MQVSIYTIRHEPTRSQCGDTIATITGATPDDAYQKWVKKEFGNGNCGWGVEVVCPDGAVIDF